jgi:hypothetical protein
VGHTDAGRSDELRAGVAVPGGGPPLPVGKKVAGWTLSTAVEKLHSL